MSHSMRAPVLASIHHLPFTIYHLPLPELSSQPAYNPAPCIVPPAVLKNDNSANTAALAAQICAWCAWFEQPDTITASAVSAREQISRALADRIRQMETAKDLEHVAEDVLPQLEKFLESPEEKTIETGAGGSDHGAGRSWRML